MSGPWRAERAAPLAWALALALVAGSRLWNALCEPLLRGYDAWGHVAYVLFLDLYRSVPHADQGWSYFHPPLHYLLGWVLAQAGSPLVLVRGLLLLSSAASLGIAVLAARLVATALPARPLLAPLVLVAVAFLPVHVYTSPMPGNEQTAAFLASLAVVVFLRNEARARPTRIGDALTGLIAGLALLAKFSGLLALAAITGTVAFRALRAPETGREPAGGHRLPRAAARIALVCGCALLVCGPYYARNVREFGTPFQLSRDTPLVRSVEGSQPPGQRSWRDFVLVSPKLLVRPDPLAPHLVHSVWGSVYLNTWLDTRPGLGGERSALARWLPWLGLLPLALFLAGFAIALIRALRSRDAPIDLTLVLLAAANLLAFAAMAWRIPIHSLLKGSYLLQLSLPYGLFLARALDALAGLPPRSAASRAAAPLAAGAAVWVLAAAAVSAISYTPERSGSIPHENARMAPVHAYFGDAGRGVEILEAEEARAGDPARRVWLAEAKAACLLESGRALAALRTWSAALAQEPPPSPQLEPRSSPWLASRWAVAAALSGDAAAALERLDAALAREPLPELLTSRAALRARDGALDLAERDLREALERAPALAPAWTNLAWVHARRGDTREARIEAKRAEELSRRAPRGFPYGIGDGFHLNDQRFMLVLDGDALALYRPGRARGAPAWPRRQARPPQ